MSESFGQSFRQKVKDVNEGKLSPTVVDVPESGRGLGSVSADRPDTVIHRRGGEAQAQGLARALTKAAGEIGAKIGAKATRDAEFQGKQDAGTAEGIARTNAAADSWHNKLFGPGARQRSAEETIVKTTTDDAYMKLQGDMDNFGKHLNTDQWAKHVKKELDAALEPHDDEGIKDTIAAKFGEHARVLAGVHATSAEAVIQVENNKAYRVSVSKTAEINQFDIDSGDPARAAEANKRAIDALKKPEGMFDAPHLVGVSDVLKQELSDGKSHMFDVATDMGMIEKMTWEDQQELDMAHNMHQARFVQEQVDLKIQTEMFAQAGDIAGMQAGIAKMNAINPVLAKNSTQLARVAYNAQLEIQQKAFRLKEIETMSASGNPNIRRLTGEQRSVAISSYMTSDAEQGVMDEQLRLAQKNGKPLAEDYAPSADEIMDYQVRNMTKYAPKWNNTNAIASPVVNILNSIDRDMQNPMLSEPQADRMRYQIGQMMKLSEKNSPKFAQHFTTADQAARFREFYQRVSVEKGHPFQVMQQIKEEVRREAAGLNKEPDEEDTVDAVDNIVSDWVRDQGDWSWNPLNHALGAANASLTAVAEGVKGIVPFVDGDSRKIALSYKDMTKVTPDAIADAEGTARRVYLEARAAGQTHKGAQAMGNSVLDRSAGIIGGRTVLGVKRLDDRSHNKDFAEHLYGAEEDAAWRAELITSPGLKADFRLTDPANRFVPSLDGEWMGIWIDGADGSQKYISVAVPKTEADLLPTKWQKRLNAVREELQDSATGSIMAFGAGLPTTTK